MTRRMVTLLLLAASAMALGCQSTGMHLLNFIGLAQRPLPVAYAMEKPEGVEEPLAGLIDPFSASRQLHDALGKAVDRSVAPDLCFSFQVEPNLVLGVSHIAFLSPLQYAAIKDKDKLPALAIAMDAKGRVERSAVLVVPERSAIRRVEELKRKKVAFGPARDPRTHKAGLRMLAEAGVQKTDLQLEVFPVVGSVRTFAKPHDLLQAMINGSMDAGFVDEQAWEALPATSSVADEPSKALFHVLGRTRAVAEQIVVGSPHLDDATRQKVTAFLLSAGDTVPDALRPLHFSGYRAPGDEVLQNCAALAADEPRSSSSGARP